MQDFFPVGSSPGFVLYVADFLMKVYGMQATVDNEINALKSTQRTFTPDILFPRMDLDEYGALFSNVLLEGTPPNPEAVNWTSMTPDAILQRPTRDAVEASHALQVLRRASTEAGLRYRYLGAFLPSPYSLVTGIIGLQTASRLLLRDRAFTGKLVARAEEVLAEYGKVLCEVADVVVILAPSEVTISKRGYDVVGDAARQLVEDVSRAEGVATFIHWCSRRNDHLLAPEVLKPLAAVGLAGINVPNVLEAAPLADTLNLVVFGGVDPIAVQQDDWQDVLAHTRKLLEGMRGRRFILGTDCHLMKIPRIEPSGTLLTKFQEMRKLVKEFATRKS